MSLNIRFNTPNRFVTMVLYFLPKGSMSSGAPPPAKKLKRGSTGRNKQPGTPVSHTNAEPKQREFLEYTVTMPADDC